MFTVGVRYLVAKHVYDKDKYKVRKDSFIIIMILTVIKLKATAIVPCSWVSSMDKLEWDAASTVHLLLANRFIVSYGI